MNEQRWNGMPVGGIRWRRQAEEWAKGCYKRQNEKEGSAQNRRKGS